MLCVRSQSCCPGALDNLQRQEGWQLARLSSSAEMVPLIEMVAQAMVVQGYPQRDIFGVWLALEERLVRSMKHGPTNHLHKQVVVRYKVDPEDVLVEGENQKGECDL